MIYAAQNFKTAVGMEDACIIGGNKRTGEAVRQVDDVHRAPYRNFCPVSDIAGIGFIADKHLHPGRAIEDAAGT